MSFNKPAPMSSLPTPYKLRELPSSEYYKWWYFDICTIQGDLITIVFHENHMFCCNDLPSVSLSFYDKSKRWERFYDTLSYGPSEITQNSLELKNGPNCIRFKGNETLIDIALPRVSGNLNIRGLWNQVESPYCLPADGISGHIWKPIFLNKEVAGKLEIDGSEKKIEGTCYHDSNHGIGYLGSVLKRWFWGRFYADKMSIVYLIHCPRHTPVCGTVLLYEPGTKPIMLDDVHIALSGETIHPLRHDKYFAYLQIEAKAKKVRLHAKVKCLDLIDAKVKDARESVSQTIMTYYRLLAVLNVEVDREFSHTAFQAVGLTEQMHF